MLLEIPDSNSYSDADSDIDSVSNPEKLGIIKSTLALSVSTSVSVCKKFPARTFHFKAYKCSPQQPRQIVTNGINIHAWPTHYSKAYNLFHLSSFSENGCKFPKIFLDYLFQRILHQDPSVTLQEYFRYSLSRCVSTFCICHLNCCPVAVIRLIVSALINNVKTVLGQIIFFSCPKLLRWLHDPVTSHHLIWKYVVTDWIISNSSPRF